MRVRTSVSSFIMIILALHSQANTEPHSLFISNMTEFVVELTTDRCQQINLPSRQMALHEGENATLSMLTSSSLDCVIQFSLQGNTAFSLLFINGYGFLYGCKNKNVASQPGYRCELLRNIDDHSTSLLLYHSSV